MSDGINVTIDAEQVNNAVASAIINSAIGGSIKQAVLDCLKTGYGSNNVIETAVKNQVAISVRDIVRDDFEDTIKKFVKEQMTDDVLMKIWDKGFGRFIRDFEKEY